MKNNARFLLQLCIFGVTALCLASQGWAQEENLESVFNKGVAHMKRQEWAQGNDVFDRIIVDFGGADVKSFYGPRFGVVYYNKGQCLVKLRKFDEAADAFKTCYERFNNKIEDAADVVNINPFWKQSLFQWAAALQYGEKYEEAIKKLIEFKSLKPDKATYSEAAYQVNLGICHAELSKFEEAERILTNVFVNADALKAKSGQLWQGFFSLVKSWVNSETSERKIALDRGIKFIDKYRHLLGGSGYDLARFTPKLVNMGQEANKVDMPELAIKLFSLVPETEEVLESIRLRYGSKGTLPPLVKNVVDTLELRLSKDEPPEVAAYYGVANAYRMRDNRRAGMVIYELLARHYTKNVKRPEILHATTSLAASVGEMLKAQEFGLLFLKEFPDHKLRPEVESMLLSSMFYAGEYEKCLEIGGEVRKKWKLGAPERDLADFVYGGSLYYLGEYEDAQPELDQHVENYPKSPWMENSLYYQGSNLTKIFRWQEASEKLDAWLKTYEPEESPLLDVAYYDRAQCYFALSTADNGGNKKALALIDKILTLFPETRIKDRAYNLKGDIAQNESRFADSQESYARALELAEEMEHFSTAAVSLNQLVPIAYRQKRYEDAIKYYDHFFKGYGDTMFAPQVAVAGLRPLRDSKPARLPEALDLAKRYIRELGEEEDAVGIEKAINSYVQFLLEDKKGGPQQALAQLDSLDSDRGNRTFYAWLLIARIGIIEKHLVNNGRMKAKLRAYYNELEKRFNKKDLSNFILMRVGLRMAEANPFKARAWFEEIISRDNPEFKDRAMLEVARADAASKNPTKQKQAVETLVRVRRDFQSAENEQEATLALARIHHELGDWKNANAEWTRYMKNQTFTKSRAEAAFKMAESYEKLGNTKGALVAYTAVYFHYASYLDYSAEAVLRVAGIRWNEGKRTEAYRILRSNFMEMKNNKHPKIQEMQVKLRDWKAQLQKLGKWDDELDKYSADAKGTNSTGK